MKKEHYLKNYFFNTGTGRKIIIVYYMDQLNYMVQHLCSHNNVSTALNKITI